MGLLDSLLGGGQQRQDFSDFVNRYDQGPPWAGISNQEAMSRYQQVAPQLSRDEYEESAAEAFARLSPQERMEFARYLQQRAQAQNVDFQDLDRDGIDDRYQDPRRLAQLTSRIQQQQPGLLEQLLGGGGGMGGGGMGGGGRSGSPLDNPLAKAAMAGIAAMAVKRVMGGR